jgi:hypothetical protein
MKYALDPPAMAIEASSSELERFRSGDDKRPFVLVQLLRCAALREAVLLPMNDWPGR